MRYLPIFDGDTVHLAGRAGFRNDPTMFQKRAIFFDSPGDAISVSVRDRQVGILFLRHDWGGIVEITLGDQVHVLDLYSAIKQNWVFEGPLADGNSPQSVKVRLLDSKNPVSRGREAWIQAIYASDFLTNEVPDLIARRVESRPFEEATLNQLTDVFKWYEADWREILGAVASSPSYTPPDFVHRKAWEWAQCIYGLGQLGMLQPTYRALGVGVGWEPLCFFFSNSFQEVVATDLYPVAGQWSESGAREGNPEILENPDKYAYFPYRRDRLQFLRMDGKRLEFADECFDVVWSCSSIEHFGGHEGAAQSMREIDRVLKPGGVAAMITEYVLPDPVTRRHSLFDPEYFNLRCLYQYIIRPPHRLRLVQNLDLSIPDYYVRRACKLPEEANAPHQGINKPHIVLRSPSGALHTSIALFFRKIGAAQVRSTFPNGRPPETQCAL